MERSRTQKQKDTGTQGHKDAEIEDTGMQGCKDARIKDTEITGTGMGAGGSAPTWYFSHATVTRT